MNRGEGWSIKAAELEKSAKNREPEKQRARLCDAVKKSDRYHKGQDNYQEHRPTALPIVLPPIATYAAE